MSPLKDTLTRTVMDETLKDKGFNQQTTRVDMKNDTNRTHTHTRTYYITSIRISSLKRHQCFHHVLPSAWIKVRLKVKVKNEITDQIIPEDWSVSAEESVVLPDGLINEPQSVCE